MSEAPNEKAAAQACFDNVGLDPEKYRCGNTKARSIELDTLPRKPPFLNPNSFFILYQFLRLFFPSPPFPKLLDFVDKKTKELYDTL